MIITLSANILNHVSVYYYRYVLSEFAYFCSNQIWIVDHNISKFVRSTLLDSPCSNKKKKDTKSCDVKWLEVLLFFKIKNSQESLTKILYYKSIKQIYLNYENYFAFRFKYVST